MNATEQHIDRVRQLMGDVCGNLSHRATVHDFSKTIPPEKEMFDGVSSALRGLTYGSDEYKRQLKDVLGPALKHHYEHNSHHPEHWGSIRRMSLLDQLEMLADWKAAGERHADGSLERSFEINRDRFKIPNDQYFQLVKTAKELGWLSEVQADMLTMGCVPELYQ